MSLHTLPRVGRIIPALAGNTFCSLNCHRGFKDHPRSRGEYYIVLDEKQLWKGSSPLSRGIQDSRATRENVSRIIPALAGNTRATTGAARWMGDHPRSRGEYAHTKHGQQRGEGSSPLSRGILQ
mgnify:CR=1 FL=1